MHHRQWVIYLPASSVSILHSLHAIGTTLELFEWVYLFCISLCYVVGLAEWHIDLSDVPGVLLNVSTEVGAVSRCKLLSWYCLRRWLSLHSWFTWHAHCSPHAAGLWLLTQSTTKSVWKIKFNTERGSLRRSSCPLRLFQPMSTTPALLTAPTYYNTNFNWLNQSW